MSSPDSQIGKSNMLPVVAAFLSVSMSIFFSQLSISNVIYEDFVDLGFSMTIATVVILYFFVFHSISRILLLESIPKYLSMLIFLSSILIIFIGIVDIMGKFIKILLGMLISIILITLQKTGIKKMQPWYFVLIFLFLTSTTVTTINCSELKVDKIYIYSDETDWTHATLSVKMKAQKNDASNIKIKIICHGQITLDEDECEFQGIDTLKKDKEKEFKWNIVIKDGNPNPFFLYFMSSDEICYKKLTIYQQDGQWRTKIENVEYLEYLLIFLKNNSFSEW